MATLTYTPLGGAGEIGMNMYVYGYGAVHDRRYIVVDAGVTFSNMETSPGVGIIMPDYRWLLDIQSRIEAVFLTHGHQDHVGAIGHIARDIDVPIYAMPFSKKIAAVRLEDMGIPVRRITSCKKWPRTVDAGPFNVGYLPISHSTPQSAGLVIDTPGGRIIHSGDFKIDTNPVVGYRFDRELWQEVSGEGIAALMCDSTNATIDGSSPSESILGNRFIEMFKQCGGMIVATTFASHVARLKQIADAAATCGRSVVLVGRAMLKTMDAAVETGVIERIPNLVSIDKARSLPRNEVCLLATGSQGEWRSAMSALSAGNRYRGLRIMPGDTVLFSSKTIPGNELPVSKVLNNLARCGARVIDDTVNYYHVSGHPGRDDLTELHSAVKPYLVIPIHGEYRHLLAHAELAKSNGYRSMVVENGTTVDLLKRRTLDDDRVDGTIYIDGKVRADSGYGFIKDRLRLAREGHVAVSVLMKHEKSSVKNVQISSSGLPDPVILAIDDEVTGDLADHLESLDRRVLRSDSELKTEIVTVMNARFRNEFGKSPIFTVAIHRS